MVFNVLDKNRVHTTRTTETHTITGETKEIHGQRAFVRLETSSDGDSSQTLANLNSQGALQLHRMADITFTPPLVFPKYAKVGQSTHMEGKADVVIDNLHPRGRYRADIRVLSIESVKVPAGTFSSVRVRIDFDVSLEEHDSKVDLSISAAGGETRWLVKRIGMVESLSSGQTNITMNGRHKLINDQVKSVMTRYSIPR